jgi:hypothetical protein
MFTYFSRSTDPNNFLLHRQARLATLNANGVPVFTPSFQLGPDTAPAPYFGSWTTNFIGEYSAVAGGSGAFTTVWPDARRVDATTGNLQPDIFFARVLAPATPVNFGLTSVVSPGTIKLGDTATLTLTAKATGGAANDVMINLPPTSGIDFISLVPPAGTTCNSFGGGVACSLGTIPSGASRVLKVTAAAVHAAGTRTITATATTSSKDTTVGNNSASAVEKSTAVATLTHPFTGIDLPVTVPHADSAGDPGFGDVKIPINLDGEVVKVVARVRLNHPKDGELILGLKRVSEPPQVLSYFEGGPHANFGTGANGCGGTKTAFDSGANVEIRAGQAPFAGTFKPEFGLGRYEHVPLRGDWRFIVQNNSRTDDAIIGCIELVITYRPT